MYEVNDYVVFGSTGVCRIMDKRMENFNGKSDREYYVLNPISANSSTIYVPTDNSSVKIRGILTKEEIMALIKAMPDLESDWISDDQLRRNTFNEILQSGDQQRLVKLIKAIYFKQNELTEIGKKLSNSDSDIMKAAEKLLYNEFALVLDLDLEQVLPFILGQV